MTHKIPPASVTRLRAARSSPRSVRPEPRILFVDDEALVARAFARSMRRRGLAVDVAQSGREALSLIATNTYDVLVTDLSMPEMDGIALIDKVMQTGVDMAYVVATGHGELYVRGEYQLTGSDIVVVDKPWKDEELATLLHQLAVRQPAIEAAQAC